MLVFFDGDCGLCDRSVRWLLDRDPEGRLHFAPLQGPTAAQRLAPHATMLEGVDSMVLLDRTEGSERVYIRSRAIFRMLAVLPGRARWLARLRILPAFLTDLGYRFVARIRKRVFGAPDLCRAPTPEERTRFLP